MIRLVASDLDGTIIDGNGVCDPSVPETVERIRKMGVKFAIVSGRPLLSVTPLLKDWNLEGKCDYVVGSQGGEVLNVNTGKIAYTYSLSVDLIKEIIDLYEPLGLIPALTDHTTLYVQKETPEVDEVCHRVGLTPVVADIRPLITEPQFKYMFIVEPEDMSKVEAFAKEHPDPRYNCFKTAKDLFEFSDPLLAKDVGLRIIGAEMKIGPEEMMAFGDTTNDLEMLDYAMYSIVTDNGTADAKKLAYAVCPAVTEQGFAQYLNEHLKSPEFQD